MQSFHDSSIERLWTFLIDRSLLLVMGALAGLLWANLSPSGYAQVTNRLYFPVNDIGMVFFFALAAKEVVEATLPGGPLASPRRAAIPIWAAVGGMIGPAMLHIALASWAGERGLVRGWAIPCATDIAFSYQVARFIFGSGHPAIPFLLLLAIADDALSLVILAIAYPAGIVRPGEFAGMLTGAVVAAWFLQRSRVMSFWPYVLVAGTLSWMAFLRGGLHPALALVPIVPFIPHGERDLGRAASEEGTRTDPLNVFARWWQAPVQVILFLFGVINAGIPLSRVGVGTWVVVAALLGGKPLGIVIFTGGAAWVGLHRVSGVTRRDMLVIGMTAAIGFTVSLFFATAAFPSGRFLSETKMGALLSLGAAGLAIALARVLGVGRFRMHAETHAS
jgi:NhaA family Na+:H+ antiporter